MTGRDDDTAKASVQPAGLILNPEGNPPDPGLDFIMAVSLWSGDTGKLFAQVTEPGDTEVQVVEVPAQFAAMLPNVLGQLRKMR